MALKIEVSADKFLYSFYKYLPTKYEANKQEWAVRQLIWDFKNGKGGFEVGKMVAEKIITQFGKRCKEMVFVCVPASNNERNTKRYEIFSQTVCRMTGMQNGSIKMEGDFGLLVWFNQVAKLVPPKLPKPVKAKIKAARAFLKEKTGK